MIVVDASIGVKWFLEEALSDDAAMLFASNGSTIQVPDLFRIEVAGALVRNANVSKANRANIEVALARFASMFADGDLVEHRQAGIANGAKLAMDIGHPLKDCLYLALAMDLQCPLVTADAKFASKAGAIWPKLQLLGNV